MFSNFLGVSDRIARPLGKKKSDKRFVHDYLNNIGFGFRFVKKNVIKFAVIVGEG